MKQHDFIKCSLAALLLVSATANAEDQYPASDFQPKVVFQDESAGKDSASSAPSKSSSSSSSSSSSDSNYPAANFQPKVVYSDDNYKHADITAKSSSATSKNDVSASVSTSEVGADAPAVKKDDSSMSYLLGLIALLGAGFFFYKKGAFGATKSSASAPRSDYSKNAGGLTGVARYVLKASGTGVSRYIEKNVKSAPDAGSAATGVAKYLANQKPTAKSSATGVEKYLKSKG